MFRENKMIRILFVMLLLVFCNAVVMRAQIETEPDSVFKIRMDVVLQDFYTPVVITDTALFMERCLRIYEYRYPELSMKNNRFVIPDDTVVHSCEANAKYAGRYAYCSQREENYLLLAYLYVLANKPERCLNFYFAVERKITYGGTGTAEGRKQIDACFAAYRKVLLKKRKKPAKSFRSVLEKELRKAKIKWVFE
jgi:hypothetical protein